MKKLLLFLEICLLAVMMTGSIYHTIGENGGAETSREADQHAENTNRTDEGTEDAITAETASVPWEECHVIAHALGGLDGYTYLNSKESFLYYYERGCRLFEVDLAQTSDGVWVCRHNWNEPRGQWEGEEARVLSEQEFLAAPLYGAYTPLTLEGLFSLLADYPDAFVLLDVKQYSARNFENTTKDYSQYLEIAEQAGRKEVLDQVVPEIYNPEMYSTASALYGFPSYLYSLWQEYSQEELEEIASFCQEKGIPAVAMYSEYWTDETKKVFDEKGILVYIYTVNDEEEARRFIENGAAGVCTDTLLEENCRK